jgi:hypothetical protein
MALLGVTAVLAGCGGEAMQSNSVDIKTYPVQTVEVQGNQPRNCNGLSKAKQAVERKRLEQDLQELRVAIKTINGQSVYGNPVVNEAVDQFERDVAEEALPVHQRSRFIDLAAAIVAPRCYWCFQVMESNRPIAAGAKLACD